jgi:ribosome recycling factor
MPQSAAPNKPNLRYKKKSCRCPASHVTFSRHLFPQISRQERQHVENSEATVRLMLQRINDAAKSATAQKQLAEAAAAVAAADLQAMTQRASLAEQKVKDLELSISSVRVRL